MSHCHLSMTILSVFRHAMHTLKALSVYEKYRSQFAYNEYLKHHNYKNSTTSYPDTNASLFDISFYEKVLNITS